MLGKCFIHWSWEPDGQLAFPILVLTIGMIRFRMIKRRVALYDLLYYISYELYTVVAYDPTGGVVSQDYFIYEASHASFCGCDLE